MKKLFLLSVWLIVGLLSAVCSAEPTQEEKPKFYLFAPVILAEAQWRK